MIAFVVVITMEAQSAVVIKVTEQMGDVVFSYSGTVDLNSTLGKESDVFQILGFYYSNSSFGQRGGIASVKGFADNYPINLVSFTLLGSNFNISGGIISGDSFLLEANGASFTEIWVPDNYVSNTYFTGDLTFRDRSLSSIGLEEGEFVWMWSNGIDTDTATFIVNSIPEPSFSILLVSGLITVAFSRYRKLATTRLRESVT